MATLFLRLARRLALRRELHGFVVLALWVPAFGQSGGAPAPPAPEPPSPQAGQRPVGTPGLIGGPLQSHVLAPNFHPAIRQVTGKPYSLVLESEQKQTLADGTNISRKTLIRRECRDSMGRTRTEHDVAPSQSHAATSFPMIQIADPVAHFRYTLNTRAKTADRVSATVVESKVSSFGRPGPMPPAVTQTSLRVVGSGSLDSAAGAARPVTQREPLGTQSFEGVVAEGFRITTTFPVGFMGNDRPLTTVCENWTSQELLTVVMSKCSDPRTGETTTRLTHAELSEPDPALFRVPADYKLLKENEAGRPWYKKLGL